MSGTVIGARVGVYARGLAMGAADVVPGVSGGTIAFVTGIYARLIAAIREVAMPQTLRELVTGRWRFMWARVDGAFLLILFLGIFTSLLSLANLINVLLTSYERQLWGFFFGLVLAAVYPMARKLKGMGGLEVGLLLLAAGVGYLIGGMTPTHQTGSLTAFFFCGALAICAMILPGISGSFILLLLGMYQPLVQAVATLDWLKLSVFLCGNLIGLLSFSHVLHWALRRFERQTFAVLLGIMLGSLDKLWPWKQTLETYLNSEGATVPLIQVSVAPWSFSEIHGMPSAWFSVMLCGLVGVAMITALDRLAAKRQSNL